MSKEEALETLEEIAENVSICCAITMDPDEVLVLIDKLKKYLEKIWDLDIGLDINGKNIDVKAFGTYK